MAQFFTLRAYQFFWRETHKRKQRVDPHSVISVNLLAKSPINKSFMLPISFNQLTSNCQKCLDSSQASSSACELNPVVSPLVRLGEAAPNDC